MVAGKAETVVANVEAAAAAAAAVTVIVVVVVVVVELSRCFLVD